MSALTRKCKQWYLPWSLWVRSGLIGDQARLHPCHVPFAYQPNGPSNGPMTLVYVESPVGGTFNWEKLNEISRQIPWVIFMLARRKRYFPGPSTRSSSTVHRINDLRMPSKSYSAASTLLATLSLGRKFHGSWLQSNRAAVADVSNDGVRTIFTVPYDFWL